MSTPNAQMLKAKMLRANMLNAEMPHSQCRKAQISNFKISQTVWALLGKLKPLVDVDGPRERRGIRAIVVHSRGKADAQTICICLFGCLVVFVWLPIPW